MPAPVPIRVEYGDPAALGGLALQTGRAQYKLLRQQKEYEDAMLRLQMRTNADESAANRAFQDKWRTEALQANRIDADRAFELQRAAQVAQQRQAELGQELQTRRAGAATSPTAAASRTAPVIQASGTGRVTGRGGTFTSSGGQVFDATGKPVVGQGVYGRPAPAPVDPNVQAQMAYLDRMAGQLPQTQLDAMRVMAQTGQLTPDQLIDNVRQAMPTAASASPTFAQKEAEKDAAELQELDIIARFGPNAAADYWMTRQRLDPDITAPADAIRMFQTHHKLLQEKARLHAETVPFSNSGGSTPTGGNVVTISSDAEYLNLPPGTWYMGPDGKRRRKP